VTSRKRSGASHSLRSRIHAPTRFAHGITLSIAECFFSALAGSLFAGYCQESSLIVVIFTFLNFFAYPEIIPICIIIVLLSSLFLFIPLFNFINFSHNCYNFFGWSGMFQDIPECSSLYRRIPSCQCLEVSVCQCDKEGDNRKKRRQF